MMKRVYVAICPKAALLDELCRLRLADETVERALFSKKVYDRQPVAMPELVRSAKEVFLQSFCEYLLDHRVAFEPFVERFDEYWHMSAFDDCEDLDDAIADCHLRGNQSNGEERLL